MFTRGMYLIRAATLTLSSPPEYRTRSMVSGFYIRQSDGTPELTDGVATVSESKMSKSAALMLSLVLAFPLVALADSNSFQNSGGQLSSNGTYLSLSGSTLSSVSMGGTTATGSLGAVSFTTGKLLSGSLDDGGTFAAGGSFQITGNGSNGIPSGVLFNGTFAGPVTWKAIWNPTSDHHGDWTYELSGRISGTLANGQKLTANFVAFTFDVSHGAEFSSSVRFKSGMATSTASVPEPGTMALLGSGLLGLGLLGFRKRSARR